MVILSRRKVAGEEVSSEVPPEADPREERQEAGDQQDRSPAIDALLLEEVVLAHLTFIERSTWGTARSPSSVISHSSTVSARASPATSRVGNCCCRTLYVV